MMSWIKRFVPFVLAFILGLFVASFFVTVGFPQVKFDRSFRHKRDAEIRRLQAEREALQTERESFCRERQRMRDEWRAKRDFNELGSVESQGYGVGQGSGAGSGSSR